MSPSGRAGLRGRFANFPLGVRVVMVALAVVLVVIAGFALLLGSSVRAGSDIAEATDAFAEEARIADEVTLTLMDQLTAASALRSGDERRLRTEFERAGRATQEQIRRYLFRDLSVEERQLLEEMAESHQLLEVAGVRSADLFALGRDAEARAAWAEMIGHTRDFLERLDQVLALRQGRLTALRSRQSSTFRTVTIASAGLGILAVGAVVLLSWLLHRRVARPLDGLAQASARLGKGDLSVRVPSWEDPELNTLSRTFNRMAANLQRTTGSLEDRNQELLETLETLRQTQDELIRSEKLGALGRMTAGLAHELNNPLTSVVGYSELLDERLDGLQAGDTEELEAARNELLEPIVREAERARHLIRNLLYFSRRSDVEVESVSLRDTVDVVMELRRGGFEKEGIEVVREDVPEARIVAEPHLLQGVLLNLVNNAFDAMKPRGRGTLRIRGEDGPDNVWLRVEDDGPGMDEPERAFDPFYTTKAPGKGTGLGLTLAHRFMEEFGGTIRAENRETGGARVVLGFRKARASGPGVETAPGQPGERSVDPSPPPWKPRPDERPPEGVPTDAAPSEALPPERRPAHPDAAASSTARGHPLEESAREQPLEEEEGEEPDASPDADPHERPHTPRPATAEAEPVDENGAAGHARTDRSALRILVVEDEEPIRTLHGRLLGRMDLRAHLTESAEGAREVLAESRVDAVLCDVKMPGESGLEFYRWLRDAHPELAERFLFVTGDVSDPELVEIMEEHPELFLHKPFDVQEYLTRVEAVVESR